MTEYVKEDLVPDKFEPVYKTTLRINNVRFSTSSEKSKLDKPIKDLVGKLISVSTTPELKTEYGRPLSISINGSEVHISVHGSQEFYPLQWRY
jgi:hypothetical protein